MDNVNYCWLRIDNNGKWILINDGIAFRIHIINSHAYLESPIQKKKGYLAIFCLDKR